MVRISAVSSLSAVVIALTAVTVAPVIADTGADGAVEIPLTDTFGVANDIAMAGLEDSQAGEGEQGLPSETGKQGNLVMPESVSPEPATSGPSPSESAAPEIATNQPAATESATSEPDAGEPADTEPLTNELAETYALFTEPIDITDPFAVAAVTWQAGGELAAGVAVEMRSLDGEQWSEWYALETDESADEGGREGTEVFISGQSTGIQVRIAGDTAELPPDLRINISYSSDGSVEVQDQVETTDVLPSAESSDDPAINADAIAAQAGQKTLTNSGIVTGGGTSRAIRTMPRTLDTATRQTVEGTASTVLSQAVGMANIKPRASWGANESIMTWPVSYANFEGVIVHHTAGSNTYTQAQVPSVIQGIYYYHAVTREWGDIGYNVLIDKYGGRWEGRSGTTGSAATKMAVGAHAKPRNTGTMGVSVMGNYVDVVPNAAVLTAIEDVSAWKFAVAGVDPRSTSPLTVPRPSENTINSALTPGSALPRIVGHRDVSSTVCPASIYPKLDEIRPAVASRYDSLNTATYMYYFNNAWSGKADIEFNWGLPTDDAFIGDWDGDGVDTLALRRGNRFAFTNEAKPSSEPVFSLTYGKANDEVLVGDWNADGKDTFAVRRGKEYHFRDDLTGGVAQTVLSYGLTTDKVLVGDWNGDSKDTLAVRRGNAYYMKDTIAGGLADNIVAYGKATDVVYVGSYSASQKADSLAVRRGNLYYVSYTVHGGEADKKLAYGRTGDTTLIGDWNGDGTDTLGVRR